MDYQIYLTELLISVVSTNKTSIAVTTGFLPVIGIKAMLIVFANIMLTGNQQTADTIAHSNAQYNDWMLFQLEK